MECLPADPTFVVQRLGHFVMARGVISIVTATVAVALARHTPIRGAKPRGQKSKSCGRMHL